MILFTKDGCGKCQYIKDVCDLSNIEVKELSDNNTDSLADLAYYSLVSQAEKTLPILVVDGETVITKTIDIKNEINKFNETGRV